MNIRNSPEYIPFMEAIITFVDLFPTDLILFAIMVNTFELPESLQLHIRVTHGEGTRPGWIRMFQWAIDTYPFHQVKELMHDAITRAGLILRYRTFIRDYHLEVLRPESTHRDSSCFPFLCGKKM